MATRLAIFDETTAGERIEVLTLEAPRPTITARELIRTRVSEEVGRYNRRRTSGPYQGLVQPPDSEVAVNGERLRPGAKLDWREQVDAALAAFERNGLLVLVDDRQVDSLDEEIPVREATEVTFLKLVPLVGG
jgi:hypothetical protein